MVTAVLAQTGVEVHDGRVPELSAETDRLRERLRSEGLADKVQTDWI